MITSDSRNVRRLGFAACCWCRVTLEMTFPSPRGYVDSTIMISLEPGFSALDILSFSGALQGEHIRSSQLQDFIYARADDHNVVGLRYEKFRVGAISRAARVYRLRLRKNRVEVKIGFEGPMDGGKHTERSDAPRETPLGSCSEALFHEVMVGSTSGVKLVS